MTRRRVRQLLAAVLLHTKNSKKKTHSRMKLLTWHHYLAPIEQLCKQMLHTQTSLALRTVQRSMYNTNVLGCCRIKL